MQERRQIGFEQDYPGSYKWPIYEVFCPECKNWSKEYGDVTTDIDGEEHCLCLDCGDRLFPITPEMRQKYPLAYGE